LIVIRNNEPVNFGIKAPVKKTLPLFDFAGSTVGFRFNPPLLKDARQRKNAVGPSIPTDVVRAECGTADAVVFT
jgi:hypothetical protein